MHSMAPNHDYHSINMDHFDRIPDSIVLVVLNKLADVRALGRCSAVSKRFGALVPLVQDICVKIDRLAPAAEGGGDRADAMCLSSSKPRNFLSSLIRAMLYAISKPFHHLRDADGGNKPLFPQLSRHSPAQVLKNFNDVRNLKIELPGGDVGTEDGVVLKWRAEFGSSLQSCVILGGTRTDRRNVAPVPEDNGSIPESFYTNGGLKLRVVWTISALIAASTRHYILRQIVEDHPTLRSLVLTDAEGQGTLSMRGDQLREFREKPVAACATSNRTHVPASNMKLRYIPYLELPEGTGVQGATLVAIKPSVEEGAVGGGGKEGDQFVCGSFDGPFSAAVKALAKRRTYLLEMNGF